ncbi:hypothetical protein Smp_174900 [Schistosoma mansoni]|uniref:hypothetical protein n=1 Tax=Schistosoma mansoni TaxID=6183 RepID=UPI0001A622BC|nr:hypothetical protein Smp_174900 [Schistosoma mansoni]|eukprot:XP_018654196.1 hypothetical protein Smp_174900 [Schistosoma mansoni]
MELLARQTCKWPYIDTDLGSKVKNCPACLHNLSYNKAAFSLLFESWIVTTYSYQLLWSTFSFGYYGLAFNQVDEKAMHFVDILANKAVLIVNLKCTNHDTSGK